MSRYKTAQRYVFKIHSSRLRRAKWHLTLTVNQARENKELITVNESQLMRFIDELNGMENAVSHVSGLKSQIQRLKTETNLAVSRPKIKKLYEELDKYQFQKDYVCVVLDSSNDYRRLCQNGFQINGIRYRRLLGTTGGIKSNTIVFVNELHLPELKRRLNNGRNLTKPFTPAKLEAYNALICSSSVPVSMPNGVVVVPDCITHFQAQVIELSDTGPDEPIMKHLPNKEITLIDSDGYGLAMPQLMKRWGDEIGEHFLLPACVIRNSFCKGTVFPVDFQKFAQEHSVTEITDVWGNTHDIRRIDLVLTASMLKLWDSYASMDDYLYNCEINHYTFAITKTSEQALENTRTMNYQFLQSYDFTDEQLDALIAPTVTEINDILSDDYRKTILYTKGTRLNDDNVRYLDNSFSTALMIEPEMKNDPYVKNQLYTMIQKRINDAKVGVLKVPANYSFVSGDPYSLCQSMFGLNVTGLLKAGQVYSKYWAEQGVDKIVSFRAPMTSHNNIRLLNVVHNAEMDAFYQYMTTPTIFNSWDTCADAMNGFDKDGDCVINTALPLLVNNTKTLPAIVCVQRKAPKCVPSEDDIVQSNIDSFGSAIGAVTNKITSMFEVQARYPKDSREYRILDYRIKCGQLYQQNAIDKAKGIEAKPMPAKWYSQNAVKSAHNSRAWQNRQLLADKKPYFMQYIYPAEKTKMMEYCKKSNEKCLMRFRMTLGELQNKKEKTPQESAFLDCFRQKMPLGTAPCTVNKICWKIEKAFDNLKAFQQEPFDYSILKSNVDYSKQMYAKIKKVYDRYQRETSAYMQYAKSERISSEERQMQKYLLKEQFKRQCLEQCPNEQALCNIVLDLCYSKSQHSKQFAWDICGDVFIQNLLKRKNYKITYPALDENGEIEFNGQHFSMKTVQLKPNNTAETEEMK